MNQKKRGREFRERSGGALSGGTKPKSASFSALCKAPSSQLHRLHRLRSPSQLSLRYRPPIGTAVQGVLRLAKSSARSRCRPCASQVGLDVAVQNPVDETDSHKGGPDSQRGSPRRAVRESLGCWPVGVQMLEAGHELKKVASRTAQARAH